VTELEKRLVSIWEEVLGVEGIGVTENFFEMGGHSLKVMEMVAKIYKELEVDVPVYVVFQYPTILQLSAFIFSSDGVDQEKKLGYIIQLTQRGTKNLFCFPGAGGLGNAFHVMMGNISDWSGYGLNFVDCSDIVNRYINEIEKIQKEGPYVFLAYSAGISLAYEVIKAFQQKGESVSHLIVLDAKLESIKNPLEEDEISQVIEQAFRNYHEIRGFLDIPNFRHQIAEQMKRYIKFSANTIYDQPILTQIHRIESESHDKWDNEDLKTLAHNGYRSYAGHGPHNRMLREPYVKENAEILQCILTDIVIR
ncbi:phosphopantetheine-binding protein, partial [Alicyclobacillus fodiniaquatilis]